MYMSDLMKREITYINSGVHVTLRVLLCVVLIIAALAMGKNYVMLKLWPWLILLLADLIVSATYLLIRYIKYQNMRRP